MSLSIIIPCFNERNTIVELVNKIISLDIDNKQIIIIDDYSNDGSRDIIRNKLENKVDKVIYNNKNSGKGHCIINGLNYANRKYTVIQDADLEYNPNDLKLLYNEILNGKEAVYGSRNLDKSISKSKYFYAKIGNIILTKFYNLFNNSKLTDPHTCYKMVNTKIFKSLNLEVRDFAICVEINVKLSNKKISIYEIPIRYNGRGYSEGKKIKLRDFFRAVKTNIHYRYYNN